MNDDDMGKCESFLNKQLFMYKKIHFFLLILIMVIPLISHSHPSGSKGTGKKYSSFFKSNIIIDGKAFEWEDSLFFKDQDRGIFYAIVNDSNNLYICLKVPDEAVQMRMLREGMDMWFDQNGKKNQMTGIHFPLHTTLNPGVKQGTAASKPEDRRKMKLIFLLQAKDMELTGFKADLNGFQHIQTGKSGVRLRIDIDSTGVLVFEARIPFKDFTGDVKMSNPLSAGFVIKGMQSPKIQEGEHGREMGGMENRGRGEGGRGVGNNRMEGQGGGFSEGEQGRPGQGQKMFEDVTIWHKFVIAK
ncbi:MAG: hypothetical protein NTX61_12890 [Bacteroidetes bacterium]|nr:hypothetical protein [Bacteroidota bacterium]